MDLQSFDKQYWSIFTAICSMLEIIFSGFRTPTIGVETSVEHSEACGT